MSGDPEEEEERWLWLGDIDDELERLRERVRRGEPYTRPPGVPLRARIEALAEDFQAGRRSAWEARLRAEKRAAGPVWRRYWEHLECGLELDPERPWDPDLGPLTLAAHLGILFTRHGQPLAKAILRVLAPRAGNLSMMQRRVFWDLGSGLCLRDDPDAERLLIALRPDDEIGIRCRAAHSRAGLDGSLPFLPELIAGSVPDQKMALSLLVERGATTPSPAIREALATWEDPSFLVFQAVYRNDREALEGLVRARGRIDAPARMLIDQAIAVLAVSEPPPAATLRGLSDATYRRFGEESPETFFESGDFSDILASPPTSTTIEEAIVDAIRGRVDICDTMEEFAGAHRFDPRITPAMALVVLADTARADPTPLTRHTASLAIWNLGATDID